MAHTERGRERIDPQIHERDLPGTPGDGTRTLDSLDELADAVSHCRRCSLWKTATQGVPGEGNPHADMMLVGEQPGDAEDIQGRPFVGPAGALLERALGDAGLDRRELWITNAVKHFKYELRGRRRLHAKPSIGEINACHWWLAEELRLIEPRLVVALGATAARSLFRRSVTITALRGTAHRLNETSSIWVTVHPSYLLRVPEEAVRRVEYTRFVQDLKDAKAWLQRRPS